MKAFTNLPQSKKLVEILPIESADMCYRIVAYNPNDTHVYQPYCFSSTLESDIPCWSLAALLDVLPFPNLSKDKLGSGKEGWMVSVYPDNCRYDSCWHDNPVDACVDMIEKLHELKIL